MGLSGVFGHPEGWLVGLLTVESHRAPPHWAGPGCREPWEDLVGCGLKYGGGPGQWP